MRILALVIIALLTTACSGPKANIAPNPQNGFGPETFITDIQLGEALLLKSTYENSNRGSGSAVSINIAPPLDPNDQVVNCPTSGTLTTSYSFNEETFELTTLTRAEMCTDGEEYIDGDILFLLDSGFQFQNLTSHSGAFCMTSTTNGTVTPNGSGLGANANLTVSYAEGPPNLEGHTFTFIAQATYSSGNPMITGSGTITREDGEILTYTMEGGTFVNASECEASRGYMEFQTSSGTLVRYEDSCTPEENPNLFINGEQVVLGYLCT